MEPSYASSVLQSNGISTPVDDSFMSGVESGFLTFEKMCGSQCGSGIQSCSGTCITGKFWALWFDSNDPSGSNNANWDHLAIHEFGVVDPSLSAGCEVQVGDVYDPSNFGAPGSPDVDSNYKYGFLGNVLATLPPTNICDPTLFEFCSPFGEIDLNDLLVGGGRSVVLG